MTRECQFRVQYDAKMFMLVNSYNLRVIERDRGMIYCGAFPGEYDLDSLLHGVRGQIKFMALYMKTISFLQANRLRVLKSLHEQGMQPIAG